MNFDQSDSDAEQARDGRNLPFLQVPLGILACHADQPAPDLMHAIFGYGAMKLALHFFREQPKGSREKHRALDAAISHFGLERAPSKKYVAPWNRVRRHLKSLDIDPDGVGFRIPVRYASEFRDRTGRAERLNENDMRVFMAIASKIGKNKYSKISRYEISFRAAGAKDAREWETLGSPERLSVTQIARSIRKLETAKLINRILVWGRFNLICFWRNDGNAFLRRQAERWTEMHSDLKPVYRFG